MNTSMRRFECATDTELINRIVGVPSSDELKGSRIGLID